MAFTGWAIPSEVNVAMAIFVLPFNSALNPFLYTFNVLLEMRKKSNEKKLLERMKRTFQAEQAKKASEKSKKVFICNVCKSTSLRNAEKWKKKLNKKHSENADTSTSVTFDLDLWPWAVTLTLNQGQIGLCH